MKTKWDVGLKGGAVVGNPIPEQYAMDPNYMNGIIDKAVAQANAEHIHGKAITPFLLAHIKDMTEGKSFAANLELARYDFKTPALLDDEEIADILGKVDALTAWASDVKEYALQQAISGKEWTGWKLVEGRSNRKYTSEAVVAATVENAGFDPYERKVLGVTAMQKMLGKSRFEELLAPYIEKPQGRPTLVRSSDKRPEWNTAKNDFMEEM